jgi:hypothetical protein
MTSPDFRSLDNLRFAEDFIAHPFSVLKLRTVNGCGWPDLPGFGVE